jgi:hypothetical protein
MKTSYSVITIFLLLTLDFSFAFSQDQKTINQQTDTISLGEKLVSQGKFHAHIRSYFMATDNEKSLTDYYANALGAGIGYESPVLHNFQIGLTGFFIFNVGSSDLTEPDPIAKSGSRYEVGLFDLTNPGNKYDLDRLEDLYVRYKYRQSKIELGRFELNTPFINRQDGRMRGTIEEGVWIEWNEWKNVKLEGGWIRRISPRSTVKWYDVADSYGVYPSGVNEDGTKSAYAGFTKSTGVGLLGITLKPIANLKIQLWNQFAENVFNTSLGRLDYSLPVSGLMKLNFGFMFIHQETLGNGGNPNPVHSYFGKNNFSNVYSGKIGLQSKKTEGAFNYTHISNEGRFLMPREWGREPFYTFIPRERSEGFAGVNAWNISLGYIMMGGRLKSGLTYGWIKLPATTNFKQNKYGLPSYHYMNFSLHYSFDHYFKGLSLQLLVVYKKQMDSIDLAPKYTFNKVNMTHFNWVVDYSF